MSPRLMDREFMRIEVSLLDGHADPAAVRARLDRRFDAFYRRMAALAGGAADARAARLMEIARLHRWLEYLHPFRDGNTRLSVLVLNKLRVEFGFSPAIIAQRYDAPYNTDAAWRRASAEGMERWQAVRWLAGLGLLDHVLSLRARPDPVRSRAARAGRK